MLTKIHLSIIISEIIKSHILMKAHIQERLAQFNSNLETIRNENPRPQYVSDFSFSCSDGDYSMDYEEFIENLKETFSNCGPTSEQMASLSASIIEKIEEAKSLIDQARAEHDKQAAVYQGTILQMKEENSFLEFLKAEIAPFGFDSVLRVNKRAIPDEVKATFQKVYEALGFTHISKEEWRDFVFFDSRKYDQKLTHIFESKYRELGGVKFTNLTGYIQIESLGESIDKYLVILDSEV